jgi:Family of unknown function (DUF6603)
MNVAGVLTSPLLDVAQAVGLVSPTQDIDGGWFEDPLQRIETILTDDGQRTALFNLLDDVLPPQPVTGAPAGSKWHPLLGVQTAGNVYLTIEESGGVTQLGLGGHFGGGVASIFAEIPVLTLGAGGLSAIAGTANGPLQLMLDVAFGWTRPSHPIALASISVALVFAPVANPAVANVVITLRGLDLDGSGAKDVTLDPAALGGEAVTLIIGLIREKLEEAAGTATGDALAVATHLIPVLGLDGSLPVFPFATLASDPQALILWLRSLATGDPPPLVEWLTHLAGLLGVAAPAIVTSTEGKNSIWSAALFAPNAASAVTAGLVRGVAADGVTQTLGIEIGAALAPAPSGPAAIDARLTLFAVPLAGPASAVVLPAASATVRAPAGTAPLIAPAAGNFSIDRVLAGIRWDGSAIAPLLELDNVVIPGAGTFPTVDLTNANTVVASAAAGLVNSVLSGLGAGGAGAHLAALAGLVAPLADPAAPLIDLTRVTTNPTSAIAALHRNALISAAHPWSIYLGELAALLSLPTAIGGTGKPGDPWSVPLASAGPLSLALVAWNAQTSGNAADPQQLRIGIRASAGTAAASASWTSALIAADLPAAGANHVTLFAEHDAAVTLQPPPFAAGTTQLSAASVGAAFSLVAGASADVTASVGGLAVTTPAGTINLPSLSYPFPAGFDPQNPTAALGISTAQLENLIAGLLSAALADALGPAGRSLAVLLGCGGGAPGLQPDLPSLADVAAGTIFTDPAGSMRAWLAKIATTLSADGSDFATPVLAWLAALLGDNLPGDPSFGPDLTAFGGIGTYDDPWLMPLGDAASPAAGLLWFEPDGPAGTTALAAASITSAPDFPSLVGAIGDAARYLGDLPDGVDPDALASGLQSVAAYLGTSDGVVPVSAQLPSGGSWGTGTALSSAHPDQPADAAAIPQILAQVDAWVAPGSPRAILLLGPAFSDHGIWSALLTEAETAHAGSTNPGAFFNLRIPGVAPASIDLRPVVAIADYYTADLQDDGSNDIAGLVAQIGLVVARLNALRPAAPLVLVAHSTAGVAARAYAAVNAASTKGLITLGTPHLGAALTPLVDASAADALRVIGRLLPGGLPPGPLQSALSHLLLALDGYLPPAAAGQLPIPWPYPVADFDGAGTTDTGGVPGLALGGQLGGAAGVDLLASLKTALAARIQAVAVAAPTHLAFGVQIGLDLGGGTSGTATVSADADLRIDIGRLALTGGAAEPTRPARALTARAVLSRPGGWLVGDSRSYVGTPSPVDIRVRGAELGLKVTLNGSTLAASPFAALSDAAFHGPTAPLVGWNDSVFAAAIGSIFADIGMGPGAAPGTRLGNLLALLQVLGIATVPADAGAAIGIAAGAVNALTVDPLGFLAPKLAAGFAAGSIPGFAAALAGGYVAPIGTLALEAFVSLMPATVGLRTVSGGAGVTLGGSVAVTGSVALPLATMQPAVSAGLAAGPANLTLANGAVSLAVSGAGTSLPLVPPPSVAEAKAAFAAMLPPLLISSVGSALIDGLLASGNKIKGLYSFLQSPWDWLIQSSALGDGTVFDPAKLTALLARVGPLPGGLTLNVSGKDPTTITLATGTPLGGVLTIGAGVTLDRTGHATPAVTLGLDTPTGGTWPSIALAFGASAAGLSLSLTPGGTAPIQLLPNFDGAAALAGAAKKLLPEALDAFLAAVAPGPKPPLVTLALDVATALDLYDAVGGFAAHGTELAALTGAGWFGSLSTTARGAFVTAATAYFNDPTSPLHAALPGTISAAGNALSWAFPLPSALGSGSVAVTAGWDGGGPTLAVGATDLALANGPITTTLAGGYAAGAAKLSGALGLSLQSSLGLSVVPQIAFTLGGGAPSLALLPLGPGTAATFSLQFAPSVKLTAASGAPASLVEDWVLPLVADLLIAATGTGFAQPLYSGGPTIETLLSNAKLITIGPGPAPQKYALKTPLPGIDAILASLLQSVPAVPIALVADPPLTLLVGNLGGQLGVALQGAIALASGTPSVTLRFGQPGDAASLPGVMLSLFTTGGTPSFAPALTVRGIGAGFAGDGNNPLFNEAGVRIGGIDGFVAFNLDLAHVKVSGLGGGLAIDQLGLPFGLLDSVTTSNPVAASLLGSNGGAGSGDTSSVNPALDVEIAYLNGSLSIKLAGTNEPVVIPVHASFGPLYIDQIDLALNGTSSVTIGIDGSLSINGLTVGVDELALEIPVPHVLTPGDWSLDLQGLAVGFSSGPVEISGGMRKNPGPPIEYDGMLSATIAGIGLTIVGAYSRPTDAEGGYTSLFLFVSLPFPLGGPPFAFITGLGGGFGYNRELIVPTDMNKIDSFLLVSAIDDDSLANDPLGALMQMSQSIPARRGAFWLAAGVRLTSFSLINSVVVVSIALDRGIDIEVLGVSRMALPAESVALVSVELALRACFNSAEQMLSVQAQLTDNSYLFSRDCQLTGGFALVIWYGEGQFVLTLGGYNPVFTKPPQFPDVPRLGFNWSVGSIVVIKGGAYFALTNSCVMAGGALSATASIGPVSAWFDAYVDFLIAWDPFAYEFDIGVEVGAAVSVTICFFGCVTIGISISVGAQLMIAGPPFHGTASIDAYVTTITISFGDPPQPPPYITDWGVFAGKYLTAGDPNSSAVSVQVAKGLLPVDPPGAQPQPGTESQPWQMGVEFVLATTTRMPASSAPGTLFGATVAVPGDLNMLDLAPMDRLAISSNHTVSLQQNVGGAWPDATIVDGADHFTVTANQGFFPEATWHWTDPQHLPAAARTIAAISGFTIDAHVALNHESALIPISALVADLTIYAKALPFATTAANVPTFKTFGADAAALAAAVASSSSQTMVGAAATILGGAKSFAANRTALGLAAGGLPPLATQALKTGRSAPPLLTPLTTGLTMEPVGLPLPIRATALAPVASVMLAQPRLRAVLQSVAAPVTDAAPAAHTSVGALLPSLVRAAPRMTPPGSIVPPALVGARLIVIPTASAPRPTRAALPARALRNADLGAATGPAHQSMLDQAAADVVANGVSLGAGATHLWDVPDDAGQFTIAGTGAVRMLCADRGGNPLRDIEFVAQGSAAQGLPPGTAMVAITCLGVLPEGASPPAAGFGAVTGRFAPTGETAALGWQAAGTLIQIGPSRFMARGATLRVIKAHATRRNGQKASQGTPRAGDVANGQLGVETRLPAAIDIVMIALDVEDETAAENGDLALGLSGGNLSTTPLRVIMGGRRLLLYDVAARDPKAVALLVSVASVSGHKIGGVIGLYGRASEWANRLSQGVPDQFVPDGALSPGGSLIVTYRGASS